VQNIVEAVDTARLDRLRDLLVIALCGVAISIARPRLSATASHVKDRYDSYLLPPTQMLAQASMGYRQAVAVVRGEVDSESARRDIVTETMRYAKRQMTWFRHQTRPVWSADPEAAHELATAWLAERATR
jgi:tRNA A37 N6-isopentenylltransferase MiaA